MEEKIREKFRIYVASPLGFSEAGRSFLYKEMIPMLEQLDFEIIDPWKLTPQAEIDKVTSMPYGQEKKDAWYKLDQIIGMNNEKGIKRADGLLAILDGSDVDSGTASEIGHAAALDKKILGYRSDFRLSGDNEGMIVNLQVQYFIEKNGGKIFTSLPELKDNIKKIFKK